jgi:hypothetical protein
MVPSTASEGLMIPNAGTIMTPARWGKVPGHRVWCADNGMYSGCVTPPALLAWLDVMAPHRETCVFATAPDVVCNAVATLDLFRWWGWRIRAKGYPVALVAQDGLESLRWPPQDCYDCLFIGGSTAWKLSDAAAWCIAHAKATGRWVHVGRVNSQRRYRHFQLLGVDSVDGTHIVFAPRRRAREIANWVSQLPLLPPL